MSLSVILAIARKDIVDAVRNLYVLFGIAFPLGMWLVFRLLLPADGDIKLGPVVIYDEGGSRLVALLKAEPLVSDVVLVHSLEELNQAVAKDALGGLALPADFDAAVIGGSTPEVTLIFDGRSSGAELSAFRRLLDDRLREMSGRPPLVRLIERDVGATSVAGKTQPFKTQDFFLVVLLVMGLAMTGTFAVPILLVEEKEKRTLKAILVSPASYADVVAGKALVGLFYALLMGTVLLALNDGLRGNVALLALAVVLGSLCLVEVGLLMGIAFSTGGQVNTWSGIVMLVLLVPTWTTGIRMSEAVNTVLHLLPTFYLSDLIYMARTDAASGDALMSAGVLLACVVFLFVANVWLLRRSAA